MVQLEQRRPEQPQRPLLQVVKGRAVAAAPARVSIRRAQLTDVEQMYRLLDGSRGGVAAAAADPGRLPQRAGVVVAVDENDAVVGCGVCACIRPCWPRSWR